MSLGNWDRFAPHDRVRCEVVALGFAAFILVRGVVPGLPRAGPFFGPFFALLAGRLAAERRHRIQYARRRPNTSRTASLAHLCGRRRGPLPHIHMGSLAHCHSLGRPYHHIHNHDHLRRGLPRGGWRSAAASKMAPARGGRPRAGPDAAGDRAAHRRAAAAAIA